MKHKLRTLIFFTIMMPLYSGVLSQIPKGQTVTYSDFSFIRDIASSTSRVYFVTTNGITIFDKYDERWEDPLTSKYGVADNDIYRIWVDRFDKELYVQTSTDLYQYDSLLERWYPINGLPTVENDDRNVDPPKVMFAPAGYNYLNDGRLVDLVGRYFSLNDLIEDESGILWMGTWGDGAANAQSSSGRIELLPFGLLQERVNAIYMDDGLLWVSGAVLNAHRTGISVFEPDYGVFEYIESGISRDFPAIDINCLAGNDSTLYAGTELGVLVFDSRSFQVIDKVSRRNGLTDDNVLSLAIYGDSVFAGTEAGLSLILPVSDTLEIVGPTQLLQDIIYDLEVVDTTLWIASSSGAYRWFWTTGRLQQFQDPHLIIFSKCLALERWQNLLWLASENGLLKLDLETGETEPFSSVSVDRNYRALAVNDSIAVMSSNLGMTMLFHDNPKPFTREFTTDDGLPSSYVFELAFDGDYLWIGTDKGLTRFWWNNPSRVD